MKDLVIDTSESQLEQPQMVGMPPAPPTALSILDKAVNSGMTPESLEKLVALAERMADRQAAQEFNAAGGKRKLKTNRRKTRKY